VAVARSRKKLKDNNTSRVVKIGSGFNWHKVRCSERSKGPTDSIKWRRRLYRQSGSLFLTELLVLSIG
jgi:hypothetical protein